MRQWDITANENYEEISLFIHLFSTLLFCFM